MCDVNLCENGRNASTKKKYCGRKGPPYSAADCDEGIIKMGNDGKQYIVKADKNGTHRWAQAREAGLVGAMPAAAVNSDSDDSDSDDDDGDGIFDRDVAGAVRMAIMALNEEDGSSLVAIKKALNANRADWPAINDALRDGLADGTLVKEGGKFKLAKKSKKSKKSSRKPKAKKSSKKKTIAQIREECKKKGLVYDRETKRCRKSKRGKKSGKKSPKKSSKKSKKMYAKGDKAKCGKMPSKLKKIKTPKVCVKVLTGPNKGKHRYVTLSAAQKGGYNPRKL